MPDVFFKHMEKMWNILQFGMICGATLPKLQPTFHFQVDAANLLSKFHLHLAYETLS